MNPPLSRGGGSGHVIPDERDTVNIHNTCIQRWNPSNLDTLRTRESVMIEGCPHFSVEMYTKMTFGILTFDFYLMCRMKTLTVKLTST